MKKIKKFLLVFLAVFLLLGGWWTYRLIWGKPLNINHFYTRVFAEYLLHDPKILSQMGAFENTWLDFYSDKLNDASPNRCQKMFSMAKSDLEMLHRYDRDRLYESGKLSYDILEWYLKDRLADKKFIFYDYPVNQIHVIQVELPQFMKDMHKVMDKSSAKSYISRLSKFGTKFNQVIEGLKYRDSLGVIPPKFVIERVLEEMDNFIHTPVQKKDLLTSFKLKLEKVKKLNDQEESKFYSQVEEQITQTVYPAYQELINYLKNLEIKSTNDAGVWKFPNGDAYYAYALRSNTTLDYSPEKVHQIGLKEVSRIETEMKKILDSLGYKRETVGEDVQELNKNKRFVFGKSEQVHKAALDTFQNIVDEIKGNISNTFNIPAHLNVEVREAPDFKKENGDIGYAIPPSLDGSRPGIFYLNFDNFYRYEMRTIAYHESIPGHLFRNTIGQRMQNMPGFRKVISFTAYSEGWAVYCEKLARELGFEKDPYSQLGELHGQLLFAVYSVVDTGNHYKRWTRQQAIDYMMEQMGCSESYATNTVDRSIVYPGVEPAYLMGKLKILELRKKARQQLGDKFNLKDFHDMILRNGEMPLTILEKVVDQYIADKK